MSLINQMLRDLEARNAVAEQGVLPNAVRPLQVMPSSLPQGVITAAVALAVLMIGGVYWQVQTDKAELEAKPSVFSEEAPATAAKSPAVQPDPTASPESVTITSGVCSIDDPIEKWELSPIVAETPPPFQQEILAKPTVPAVSPIVPAITAQTASALPIKPLSRAANPTPIVVPVRPAVVLPEAVQRHLVFGLKVDTVLSRLPQSGDRDNIPKNAALALADPAVATKPSIGPVVIDKQDRLATAGDRADSQYRKAVALLNLGNVEKAAVGFRAALQEDPSHINARQTLASILVEQKQLEEAQRLLEEGLVQNPSQPAMAVKLARVQVERNDIKAANETLRRSAVAGSDNPDYRAFSAGVLQRLGDHSAAINEYLAALRLAPEANIWWMGLAISLDAEGKRADAREAFLRSRNGKGLPPELDRFVEQKLKQL